MKAKSKIIAGILLATLPVSVAACGKKPSNLTPAIEAEKHTPYSGYPNADTDPQPTWQDPNR